MQLCSGIHYYATSPHVKLRICQLLGPLWNKGSGASQHGLKPTGYCRTRTAPLTTIPRGQKCPSKPLSTGTENSNQLLQTITHSPPAAIWSHLGHLLHSCSFLPFLFWARALSWDLSEHKAYISPYPSYNLGSSFPNSHAGGRLLCTHLVSMYVPTLSESALQSPHPVSHGIWRVPTQVSCQFLPNLGIGHTASSIPSLSSHCWRATRMTHLTLQTLCSAAFLPMRPSVSHLILPT